MKFFIQNFKLFCSLVDGFKPTHNFIFIECLNIEKKNLQKKIGKKTRFKNLIGTPNKIRQKIV